MILFKDVAKKYKRQTVLSGLNLHVPKGKTVTLIGPSGSGKTTSLKMVNRLIDPTSGSILVNGKDIAKLDIITLRRNMGFVIQHIGLFPHMTVRENIEIIAKAEKRSHTEISQRTLELMDIVGLEPSFLERYPSQLSGGQQQRVGVARAFALDPEIILMDEPFSALDPITRSSLQDELATIQDKLKKTILFVTHDMDEAIRVGDLICIMKEGKIVQYDTPENILRNPATEFVAEFIGKKRIQLSPNLITAQDIMIENLITCTGSLPLYKCIDRMHTHQVDTLLVIETHTNILKGTIHINDIKKTKDHTLPVAAIMHTDYTSAYAETLIDDIMKQIQDLELTCVPVITPSQKLIGLVTKSSLFATLSRYYIDGQEVQNESS